MCTWSGHSIALSPFGKLNVTVPVEGEPDSIIYNFLTIFPEAELTS
jgi:hypothetical protein